jgi:hypothetical protein
MNPSSTPLVYDSATASLDDVAPSVLWRAEVTVDCEPMILSRLLQKLVCQGAQIRLLQYSARDGEAIAHVAITFSVNPVRAQLLARQWRTLIPVSNVVLIGPLPP